jgi:hypothetical protein
MAAAKSLHKVLPVEKYKGLSFNMRDQRSAREIDKEVFPVDLGP